MSTRAERLSHAVKAPFIYVNKHRTESASVLAIGAIVFGLLALGVGLYALLSQGVVNAALGQAGGLALTFGGGAVAGGGFLTLSAVGAKKRYQYDQMRRGYAALGNNNTGNDEGGDILG